MTSHQRRFQSPQEIRGWKKELTNLLVQASHINRRINSFITRLEKADYLLDELAKLGHRIEQKKKELLTVSEGKP